MLISNAIGIIFGIVMGKRIPERTIKWAAALIFIGFGIWGLHETLSGHFRSPVVVAAGAALLGLSIYVMYRIGGKEPQLANVCERAEAHDKKT